MKKFFNNKILIIALSVIIITFSLIIHFSNTSSAKKYNEPADIDPAFAAYISSYTAGVISSNANIQIILAQNVADSTLFGKPVAQQMFDFNPRIKGQSFWLDERTIEFRPDNQLPNGKKFEATFHLDKIMEVAGNLNDFGFIFQTIVQNFDVQVNNLLTVPDTNLKQLKIKGELLSADFASNEVIEKIISADQDGNNLNITWMHQSDGRTHHFIIENVSRREKQGKVNLHWSGNPFGLDKEGKTEITIPALGDFKLIDSKVIQSPEQYVSLKFSDPLKQNQFLQGLISIEGIEDPRFIIEENEIKVYAPVRQTGSKIVTISPGIENILGYKLDKELKTEVEYIQVKPAVRLTGKGTILPGTSGLIFPFEAVSLNAVDVSIIKIFENNVAQFLQVNNLEGNRELRRVGRPLTRKVIPLNTSGVTDLNKWNRFTLDLSELIETEPGAIYQVKIGFRKQHSVYFC